LDLQLAYHRSAVSEGDAAGSESEGSNEMSVDGSSSTTTNIGSDAVPATSSSRLSPIWRRVLTVILSGLFVLSFLLFTLGVVVKKDLLDPELYVQVLAENDVYDRLYTEVLADPEMQDRFREKVSIDLDLVVEELYSQVVAAGALVVPPVKLQAASEKVIRDTVGYVRGDVPELDARVRDPVSLDPEVMTRRIVAALTVAISENLASRTVQEKDPAALDVGEIQAYVAELASGNIKAMPQSVLAASVAQLSDDELTALVDVLLGPAAATADTATKLQIKAALASDDLAGAVATASMHVLAPRVEEAARGFVDRVAGSGTIDGLGAVALALDESKASLVQGLNDARGYAAAVQKALLPLATLMLLLMLAIVWINGRDLRSMLASSGWVLVVSGLVSLALWILGRWWLSAELASRLEVATGLPPGLRNVLEDVVGSLAGQILGTIWGLDLLWIVLGCLALAFAYSEKLAGWLRKALQPVWPHRVWVVAGVIGILVVLPLLGRVATAKERAANPPCNGHPELCDRRLDEVAYATSHNAMSITEYGWLWPMHDGTATDQLEAGVRALMIDTMYVDDEETEDSFLESLSPTERAVAEERIARVGSDAVAGTLLCHGSCKLGSTLMAETLDEIRSFLENNPREVVFVIIQDEITAEDTEKSFDNSGLVDHIFVPRPDERMPTLGELIDADKRLVVMAENQGPPPEWYPNAWDLTEETPYTFVFKEDFSCEPNRGGTGKPFFLLNHWIQRGAPNRVDAAVVNDFDFLYDRAMQCAQERGKMPNFIAVNFYGQGDLMRVVDALNGVLPKADGE
jgi:hypothetical protein